MTASSPYNRDGKFIVPDFRMIDANGCTITLYTQRSCAASAAIRGWLADAAVPFVERNVTDDESAAGELAATGIFATPLTSICGKYIFGNRPADIRRTIETCERRTAC